MDNVLSTQQLLNAVAYPKSGQNIRRKEYQLFDVQTIATATTAYYPYTSTGTIFTNNQKFPLSGSQIFGITNICVKLSGIINSQTLYEGLLTGLQQSYLEIVVDARQMLKIPMIEVLSYMKQAELGTTAQSGGVAYWVKRSKTLIYPIVLNSQSNVQVNCVLSSTFTTAFNAKTLRFELNGIMLDKLDSLSVNLLQGKQFGELAWTLWESQAVSTVNQNTFNFFSSPNTSPSLFNGILPLSSTELLEIQAIEIFIGGNYGTTDTPNGVRDNRGQNVLTITVENVEFYKASIADMLSQATASNVNFSDTAGTSPIGNINVDVSYQQKVLKIPLIIPASGNVSVQLTQPGSSLNSGQYITLMLKGKKTRQVI